MFKIADELESLENGFNFYPLRSKNSIGFRFVWGESKDGKSILFVRYSKYTKKFGIFKLKCSSEAEIETFTKM